MPFKSQKQRALFYAAKHDPAVRKKHGMSEEDVDKMISHDEGDKLPTKKGMMKKLAEARRKSRGK